MEDVTSEVPLAPRTVFSYCIFNPSMRMRGMVKWYLGIAVGLRVGKYACSVAVANTLGRTYTQRRVGEMTKTCLNRHVSKILSSARSTE